MASDYRLWNAKVHTVFFNLLRVIVGRLRSNVMGIGNAVAAQALSTQQAMMVAMLQQAAQMQAQMANMLADSVAVPAGSLGQSVNISA
jgi:hypothetical protein